jgi:hypothetical protein
MRRALIGGACSALVIVALAGCSDDTTEPPATLDPAHIDEALLTLDDLPDGYTVFPASEPGRDGDCDPDVEPDEIAVARFEHRLGLSRVQHEVRMFRGSGAQRYFDAFQRAIEDCRTEDVTYEPRSVDDTGDEVVAYRATYTDGDSPLTIDFATFISGDVVVGVATSSVVGPPSAALDAELLDMAEERLELAIEG